MLINLLLIKKYVAGATQINTFLAHVRVGIWEMRNVWNEPFKFKEIAINRTMKITDDKLKSREWRCSWEETKFDEGKKVERSSPESLEKDRVVMICHLRTHKRFMAVWTTEWRIAKRQKKASEKKTSWKKLFSRQLFRCDKRALGVCTSVRCSFFFYTTADNEEITSLH